MQHLTTAPTTPSHHAATPVSNSEETITADRITELSAQLEDRLSDAIRKISKLNSQTKFVSINAQIEAARAGGRTGAAFGVVAQAILEVSAQTADVAKHLETETHLALAELKNVNRLLATRVRGERLADLALMNIDVIDRNLYERSCDVRWWATDSSVVNAVCQPSPQTLEFATFRLGQILNSYTVYFDIVVTDAAGRILANGRPRDFRTVGMDCRSLEWFQAAVHTRNGEEFGFQSVHPSPLARDERVLVYSCGVRENGDIHGPLRGVLAVAFRFDALAQAIVTNTRVNEGSELRKRVCITDRTGLILADTDGKQLQEKLAFPEFPEMLRSARNYALSTSPETGTTLCIGHARAPGFETYSTGWHSWVMEEISARHG